MQSIHYSCTIIMKLEFSGQFSKNTPISDFMKICSMGEEPFHVDRRTVMTKL